MVNTCNVRIGYLSLKDILLGYSMFCGQHSFTNTEMNILESYLKDNGYTRILLLNSIWYIYVNI